MIGFMDLTEYRYEECTDCNGSGNDVKKRKRKCPVCGGSGKVGICIVCNKRVCTCHPGCM